MCDSCDILTLPAVLLLYIDAYWHSPNLQWPGARPPSGCDAPGSDRPALPDSPRGPVHHPGSAMFRLTCSTCHHGLKARESLAGKNVRCPGCGSIIAVPEPPASPDDPAQPFVPSPPAFESHPAPPSEGPGPDDGNPTRPAP